jgi:hypothetical protein
MEEITIPVRRPLLPKDTRTDLRRLAANADGFRQRAEEPYDVGYGQALTDLLRWLDGAQPTGYLTEAVAD